MLEGRLEIDKTFNFQEFYNHYISLYLDQYFIFIPNVGYIVWRYGTGENVELLHIRSFETGKGTGPKLVKVMLRELQKKPPFFSIFGFMLASNEPVIKMYRKMGFNTMEIPAPYKGCSSVMICQSYDVLCSNLMDEQGKKDADKMIDDAKKFGVYKLIN